jgi:hypothetical protein
MTGTEAPYSELEKQAVKTNKWLHSKSKWDISRESPITAAEQIVLDCLRTLQKFDESNSEDAIHLMDEIAKVFLHSSSTDEIVHRRAFALLKISAGK